MEKSLTYQIIGCAIEVHRQLGPGLLESVYEEALEYELKQRGFDVQRQVNVPLRYKGVLLKNDLRIDLIVNDTVIIELKSVEKIQPVYYKQLLTYLRLYNKKEGLLINFNEEILKKGIYHIANGCEDNG